MKHSKNTHLYAIDYFHNVDNAIFIFNSQRNNKHHIKIKTKYHQKLEPYLRWGDCRPLKYYHEFLNKSFSYAGYHIL